MFLVNLLKNLESKGKDKIKDLWIGKFVCFKVAHRPK